VRSNPEAKKAPARRNSKGSAAKAAVVVLTIGHSTRELDDFIHLLKARDVALLVDVRTISRSRHNPQFNEETLSAALRSAGIGYRRIAGLGGLRRARADSPNKAWRNASFRGFADYMQTSEFEQSLLELIGLAQKDRVALMCAEAVPWRCHRSLIADALVARGIAVEHIMSAARRDKHAITPWAMVKKRRVTYPGDSGTRVVSYSHANEVPSSQNRKGQRVMSRDFKVGDHVAWNSEAGRVRGTIKKKITSPITFKGYTVRASKEQPQYLIKSDKTEHLAVHKVSTLKKVAKRSR
jgi:hypothetical protein